MQTEAATKPETEAFQDICILNTSKRMWSLAARWLPPSPSWQLPHQRQQAASSAASWRRPSNKAFHNTASQPLHNNHPLRYKRHSITSSRRRRRTQRTLTTLSALTKANHTFNLPNNSGLIKVSVFESSDGSVHVHVCSEGARGRLALHWGLVNALANGSRWEQPPNNCWPAGSVDVAGQAVETLLRGDDGVQQTVLPLGRVAPRTQLQFAVREGDSGVWHNRDGIPGTPFSIPLYVTEPAPTPPPPPQPPPLPAGIVEPSLRLCEKWAYQRWEAAGRPPRSQQEAAAEFERVRADLKALMALSITEDQLITAPESVWASDPHVGHAMPQPYAEASSSPARRRRAGVLLHPTSLPGPAGCGDMGYHAYRFVDWMAEAGMTIWQVLPLVPPGRPTPSRPDYWSPYSGSDSSAGNTLLVAIDALIGDGLLDESDRPHPLPAGRADFPAVAAIKGSDPANAWAWDAGLFTAIDRMLGGKNFWEWPPELRDRDKDALARVWAEKGHEVDVYVAEQFLFNRQWQELKSYANSKGVSLFGDAPIYVGGHSADVWCHRTLFCLDPVTGAPAEVSGVPPDAFSATGQRWGSPLYNWTAHQQEDYAWWTGRLRRSLELYDELRIDHFRGLAGYWAINAKSATAMEGEWRVGPGQSFFDAIARRLGGNARAAIVAEDLGVITPDVVALRESVGAPGMSVLLFAFEDGKPRNVHLPHNHRENSVVYPGTHDNDTVLGYYQKVCDVQADELTKHRIRSYLGTDGSSISWDFIRCALSSVGRTAIVSMQDVLALDSSTRMNVPGVAEGNWAWRVEGEDLFTGERGMRIAKALRELAAAYERL
eukprot:jgi/Chlat1/1258/Chrsp115S00761